MWSFECHIVNLSVFLSSYKDSMCIFWCKILYVYMCILVQNVRKHCCYIFLVFIPKSILVFKGLKWNTTLFYLYQPRLDWSSVRSFQIKFIIAILTSNVIRTRCTYFNSDVSFSSSLVWLKKCMNFMMTLLHLYIFYCELVYVHFVLFYYSQDRCS